MLSMTRIGLVEKPSPAVKGEKEQGVRRYVLVRLPPKYAYLREAHD
jgi:hypothetical protein